MSIQARFRSSLLAALMGLLALGSTQVHAGLVGTMVDVTLSSPGDGLLLTDLGVLVGAGPEIAPGINPSNIGGATGAMLTGATASEFIDIGDFSISLRLLAGASGPPPTTGWAANAAYIFSGLNIVGMDIIGVTLSELGGIANFDAGWATRDSASQISLRLDLIAFTVPNSGTTYGDLRINLVTQATGPGPGPGLGVPEPGSMALVGLALVSLWASGRRRGARSIES